MLLPIGSRLPRTKYLFDKYFNGFRQGLEYKFFCPSCETLIKTSDSLKCTICDEEYERQQPLEKGNFFLYLSIEKQLKDFCPNRGVSKDLGYRFNRVKDDDVSSDIYDGQMYKSLGNGLLASDRNAMSLSYNCDLVPVFQSSNFSIWPLQAMLNELPPQNRKRHIFLVGLWFGSSKPNIAAFLDPFTSEMRRLGSVGMKWLRNGVEVCSKVFACICSCDSVARALLQNIHQFNGIYGCSWCYNPGVRIQISYSKMAPQSQTAVSIFTGIISSIIAYIQLNIAMLQYQANYERMRATLVRLLSMPVARTVCVKRLNKRRKARPRSFGLDLGEQMLDGLVLSTKLSFLRSGGRIFE